MDTISGKMFRELISVICDMQDAEFFIQKDLSVVYTARNLLALEKVAERLCNLGYLVDYTNDCNFLRINLQKVDASAGVFQNKLIRSQLTIELLQSMLQDVAVNISIQKDNTVFLIGSYMELERASKLLSFLGFIIEYSRGCNFVSVTNVYKEKASVVLKEAA